MATTYEPIATYTIPSAQASYTFSSIPATYTDLIYIIANVSGGTNSTVRFNSDSATNYSMTQLYGNGTAANSLRGSSTDYVYSGVIGTNGVAKGYINNYSNNTTYKTIVGRGGSGGATYLDAFVGLWRSTAIVNSITFYQDNGATNWATGTTITLYGIKAA